MALEKGAPVLFLPQELNERKALPKFQSSAKGKEWGERLLKFAKENPYRERDGRKEYRPLLEEKF